MTNKKRRIELRVTEKLLDRLDKICENQGRTRTAVIEDLITKEFEKSLMNFHKNDQK